MNLFRIACLGLFVLPNALAQDHQRFAVSGPNFPYVGEVGDAMLFFPEATGEGTYVWDFGDGRTHQGPKAEVTYTAPGVYQTSVTYTDENGAVSGFNRWVFINDPNTIADFQNQAPHPFINTPEFGATFPVNAPITFQGHGVDPEGEAVTLYWDFDDGDLLRGDTQPQKTYTTPGRVFPKLFVRDATGYTQFNLAFLELDIYTGPAPPQGRILKPIANSFAFNQNVYQTAADQPVCLAAQVVDLADPTGYEAYWNIYGPTEFGFDGFTPEPQVWPPGFYDVFLEVADPSGLFDPIPDQVTVWVRDDNRPPENVTIDAPNYDLIVKVGEDIGLSGSAEDLDGDTLTYLWNLGDGRVLEGRFIDRISYTAPGLYALDLTVEDGMGGSTPAQRRTWVRVVDPGSSCDFSDPPDLIPIPADQPLIAAVVGQTLQFAVEPNPKDGEDISDIFWDFSRGLFAEGAQGGPIAFEEPGFYPVRVFARNQCDLWTVLEAWSVFVSAEGNLAPEGRILSPQINGRNGRGELIAAVPIGQAIDPVGQGTDGDGQLPLSGLWLYDYQFYATGDNPPPITINDLAEHNLQYHVTDAAGNQDPFPAEILVKGIDPTLEPTATISLPDGDIVALPGQALVFEALGQDPNGLFLSYEWDFGPAANRRTATGARVEGIVFADPSPAGDPYVVRVSAATPFTAQSQPTEVRITVKQFADTELEPNNSIDQAATIQRGSYRNLTLADGDATDVFRFTVDQSGRDLEVNLGAEGAVTPTLYRLENGVWIPLPLSLSRAASGGVVLESVAAGDYALEVKAAVSTKMGLSYSMGIATLLPSLYLPFIVEDGNLESSLGILNPTGSTSSLSLTGVAGDGTTVAEISLDLGPGARLNLAADQLFGQEGVATSIRWVRVRATTRLMGYTNTASVDGTRLMSSNALTSLAPSITVPHIADPDNGWYTRAVLINALDSAHPLQFTEPGSRTKIADMNAATQSDFRFTDVLPNARPGWGAFGQDHDQPGLAGIEVFGRVDDRRTFAAIEMAQNTRNNPNFTYADNELYFTHIAADVANWWTGLSLINLGSAGASYTIIGYNNQGGVTAEVTGQLEAGGKLLRTARALFGEADVDWVRVQSDAELSGFELFGSHQLNRMAGFNATGRLADNLYFPHVEPTSVKAWTGISILNVADAEVQLVLSAFNDAGTELARVARSLGPRTKLVQTAQALFADVGYPEGTTYIRVTANQKSLAGFELFGTLNPTAGGLGELLAGLAASSQ